MLDRRRKCPTVLSRVVLIGIIAAPEWARAEWFLDVYAGWATTETSDVSVTNQNCSLFGCTAPQQTTRPVQFDTSNPFGVRLGYWFESVPWLGLAGDLSFFEARAPGVDVTLVPFSTLVMVRYPLLVTEALPKGRLQPYLGIGPSFAIYQDASVDFRPGLPTEVNGVSSDVGLDLRVGVAWQFHRHFALFGEYRYTSFSVDIENEPFVLPFGNFQSINGDINTQHFQLGVSFRF